MTTNQFIRFNFLFQFTTLFLAVSLVLPNSALALRAQEPQESSPGGIAVELNPFLTGRPSPAAGMEEVQSGAREFKLLVAALLLKNGFRLEATTLLGSPDSLITYSNARSSEQVMVTFKVQNLAALVREANRQLPFLTESDLDAAIKIAQEFRGSQKGREYKEAKEGLLRRIRNQPAGLSKRALAFWMAGFIGFSLVGAVVKWLTLPVEEEKRVGLPIIALGPGEEIPKQIQLNDGLSFGLVIHNPGPPQPDVTVSVTCRSINQPQKISRPIDAVNGFLLQGIGMTRVTLPGPQLEAAGIAPGKWEITVTLKTKKGKELANSMIGQVEILPLRSGMEEGQRKRRARHPGKLDPRTERTILIRRAVILWRQHQRKEDEALGLLEQVLTRFNKKDPIALTIKAEILVDQGRHSEAEVIATSVIERDPNDLKAFFPRIRARTRLGNYQGALKDANWVINQGGFEYDVRIRVLRAEIYLGLGFSDKKRAMQFFSQAVADAGIAIRTIPENSPAWDTRARALREFGRSEEALLDATRLVELTPGKAGAWALRAAIFNDLGRYAEAVEDATRALSIRPDAINARLHRTTAWMGLHEDRYAMMDAQRIIQLDPQDIAGYHLLAKAAILSNELGRAEESLKIALELASRHNGGNVWFTFGLCKVAQQQFAQARAVFEQAARFFPGHPLASKYAGQPWETLSPDRRTELVEAAIRSHLKPDSSPLDSPAAGMEERERELVQFLRDLAVNSSEENRARTMMSATKFLFGEYTESPVSDAPKLRLLGGLLFQANPWLKGVVGEPAFYQVVEDTLLQSNQIRPPDRWPQAVVDIQCHLNRKGLPDLLRTSLQQKRPTIEVHFILSSAMKGESLEQIKGLVDKGLTERFFDENADAIRRALDPDQPPDPSAGMEEVERAKPQVLDWEELLQGAVQQLRRAKIEQLQATDGPAVGYLLGEKALAIAPVLAVLETQRRDSMKDISFAGVVKTAQDKQWLMGIIASDPEAYAVLNGRLVVADEQDAQDPAGRMAKARERAEQLLVGKQITPITTLEENRWLQMNNLLARFRYRLPEDPTVRDAALTLLEAA